ncbi:C40 family peptidase [Streptomyces hydrogenans]|uniref:C40 family peptidase n=1 Tax=Streptomyces hydrogenans TaxID=1873719 RepID=UPI0035DBDE5E
MASIADVIAAAMAMIGTPYSWGGGGPGGPGYGIQQGAGTRGFDCSSLMQYAFSKAGIKIGRTTYQQINNGSAVGLDNLQAGDLVFSHPDSRGYGHVGLYLGNGMVIESPYTGASVRVVSLSKFGAKAARRTTGGLAMGDVNAVLKANGQSGGEAVPGGFQANQMVPGSGWSKQDFEAALASAGFTSALINSDKSLKTLFSRAVQGMWTADRFLGELKLTKWWQDRSDAQRKYDQLQKSDPKEFQAQWDAKKAEILEYARTQGITLTGKRLDQLTTSILRNGFNESQIKALVAAEFKYNPLALYSGVAGKAVSDYQAMAGAYFVDVSDATLGRWVADTLNGSRDSAGFQAYLKDQAKKKWAHFADKLDAGMTMEDIADPYKQLYSKLLEVSGGEISNDDALLLKGLDYRDPGSGNRGAMTFWQFEDALRADGRWLKTDNAKQATMGIAHQILQTMGLVAA